MGDDTRAGVPCATVGEASGNTGVLGTAVIAAAVVAAGVPLPDTEDVGEDT
jgi:hypothetical protein